MGIPKVCNSPIPFQKENIFMKTVLHVALFCLLSVVALAQKYAVTSGAWTGTIWANSATGVAGEATQPTATDDVVIDSAIVVSVASSTPACKNISFADTSARLAMNAGGVLNVNANFILKSALHNAFSAWASGAKLRFTGAGPSMIQNLSLLNTGKMSTFMEIQINKLNSTDTVKTPGNDSKLALGTSLEIISGVFYLGTADDINTRLLDGTGAPLATITIEPNGKFYMAAGASQIRSGVAGTNPIGKMTIRGSATVSTTSTNRMNIGTIDVESGGLLTLNTGWSTSNLNLFNPGIITVKEGGMVSHVTTTNIWAAGTTMLLNKGGVYKTSSSATIFPPTFSNNGTVRYARTTSPQTIIDTNYFRLEISFDSTKIWTLGANRVIVDTLEINNTSTLKILSTVPRTLTVNGTVRLTSGTLDNSDTNATLVLGENVLISRATGALAKEPVFGSAVSARYTSSQLTITTGPEIPTAPGILKKLTINSARGVQLGKDATVNDSLILDDGYLFLGDKTLTIAAAAGVGGSPCDTSMVVQTGTGMLKRLIDAPKVLLFPIGDTTMPARYTPAQLTFTAGSFTDAAVTVKAVSAKHPSLRSTDSSYINRYWTVKPVGISGFSANVQFAYHDSDVVGSESRIVLGQYAAGTWEEYNTADTTANLLSGTVTHLADFTGVKNSSLVDVQPVSRIIPAAYSLEQNYPNPFNPATTIRYGLPKQSRVKLEIYSLLGQKVHEAVNALQEAGIHIAVWNAGVSSGVYYYRIEATPVDGGQPFVRTYKMLLMR